MNRSVLIVIVDFLLISLLAFSRFDEPDVVEKPITGTALPASATGRQDLVDVLKVSLDKERESREQLNEQLRQAQAQLQGREQVLTDREKLMREAEALLREKADEAARLARSARPCSSSMLPPRPASRNCRSNSAIPCPRRASPGNGSRPSERICRRAKRKRRS